MAESIRVAAAGDIHCAEPLRERIAHAFAERRGPGGRRPARRRPDDARRAGAGGGARRRVPAARAAGLRRARQPRLPREPLRRGGRRARGRGHPRPPARLRRPRGRRARARDRRREGVRRRLPRARSCPTSASRSCARSTPRRRARSRRSRPGSRRSRAATGGIVLLHYAPVPETLVGEPETIWAFLGSSRLAAPIGAHRPDLVLHGHAHRGSFATELGPVPVRNVAVHVIGKDFEHLRALSRRTHDPC